MKIPLTVQELDGFFKKVGIGLLASTDVLVFYPIWIETMQFEMEYFLLLGILYNPETQSMQLKSSDSMTAAITNIDIPLKEYKISLSLSMGNCLILEFNWIGIKEPPIRQFMVVLANNRAKECLVQYLIELGLLEISC